MENEQDLVVFQDDDGNEFTLEVLDYFFYEGEEYAVLSEPAEDDEACEACDMESCEGCKSRREAYIMKVVPVGDDEEEFVPIDDELAEKLMEIVENEYDEDEIFEDDEE